MSSGIASSFSVITRTRYSRKCSGSTPSDVAMRARTSFEGTGRLPWTMWFRYPAERPGLVREPAVRRPRLGHQPLDGRARRARCCTAVASPSTFLYPFQHVWDRNALVFGRCPRPDVDRAVLQGLPPDGHAHRSADEIRIGELLPRPLVAVVEEHVEPRRARSSRPPSRPRRAPPRSPRGARARARRRGRSPSARRFPCRRGSARPPPPSRDRGRCRSCLRSVASHVPSSSRKLASRGSE